MSQTTRVKSTLHAAFALQNRDRRRETEDERRETRDRERSNQSTFSSRTETSSPVFTYHDSSIREGLLARVRVRKFSISLGNSHAARSLALNVSTRIRRGSGFGALTGGSIASPTGVSSDAFGHRPARERNGRTARRSRENSQGANARVRDTATANHLYAFLVLLSYNVSLDAYLLCYCGYTSVVYVFSMRVAVLAVLVLPPPCLSRRRRLRRRGRRDETTRRRGAFVR